MLDLPFVEFDELLAKANVEVIGGNIKANAASHELFRRAFEEGRRQRINSAVIRYSQGALKIDRKAFAEIDSG